MAGEEEAVVNEAETIVNTPRNWKHSENSTADEAYRWLEGIKEGDDPEIARSSEVYGIVGITEVDAVDAVTHATSNLLNSEFGKELIKRELLESGSPPDSTQDITDEIGDDLKNSALFTVEVGLRKVGKVLAKGKLPTQSSADSAFELFSLDSTKTDEPLEKAYKDSIAGKILDNGDNLLNFPIEYVSRLACCDLLGFPLGADGEVALESPYAPLYTSDNHFTDIVKVIPSQKIPGVFLEIAHSYVNDREALSTGRINKEGLCMVQESILVKDPKEVEKDFGLAQHNP